MYNKEITSLFANLGIKFGDTIHIISGTDVFDGILMPRADAGENDKIVIKRPDGYNVGIKYRKDMKISKTGSIKEHFSFAKVESTHNKSLKTISMLYTGGTIGSKVDYVTGGVHVLTTPEELLYEVPELQKIANINIKDVMHVFSDNISYQEWTKMAVEVDAAFKGGSEGVIIAMGTDTMHYTSAALSFMLNGLSKPVVITGAQRSSDRGSSDAFINLACAAQLATNSNIGEVVICMHENSSDKGCIAIRGTKVRKMHTSRRDAFRPINSKPIARTDTNGKIEYISSYKKSEKSMKLKVLKEFEPKTALVKVYPNSEPGIIDFYLKKDYKGIIIEGTGLGHVPIETTKKEYSWLSSIKSAVDSGVVVGLASQCLYGRVDYKVYSQARLLHEAGVIYCEDMMPEVAYVKLGFLLGNYDAKKAKEMLGVNIAGEITTRTEFDTFEVD